MRWWSLGIVANILIDMNNKPIYYIELIRLIKTLVLKSQTKIKSQSLSSSVNPSLYLTYKELTFTINKYWNYILIGNYRYEIPSFVKSNTRYPLGDLCAYLYKIDGAKQKHREKYAEINSKELYNKHLKLIQK